MKHLFYPIEDLNQLISEIYSGFCKVGYSEDFDRDIIEWYNEKYTEIVNVTNFEEITPLINQKFNVTIKKFNVVDLADYGIGFIFFF